MLTVRCTQLPIALYNRQYVYWRMYRKMKQFSTVLFSGVELQPRKHWRVDHLFVESLVELSAIYDPTVRQTISHIIFINTFRIVTIIWSNFYGFSQINSNWVQFLSSQQFIKLDNNFNSFVLLSVCPLDIYHLCNRLITKAGKIQRL